MAHTGPKAEKESRKRSAHHKSDKKISKKRRSRSPGSKGRFKKRTWTAVTQIRPKEKATEKEGAAAAGRKLKEKEIEKGWDDYRIGNKWVSLPPRWADETDLDPEDLDARILRCERRIAQGIVPKAFELKLKRLLGMRDARQRLINTYPRLDYNTIQRLETLKVIEAAIVKNGDPCKELPNVRALMAAYRKGKLEFDGRVTYWSGGEKVGEAAKFEVEDFRKLNKGNKGEKGFWVEGVLPEHMQRRQSSMNDGGAVTMICALRLGQSLEKGAAPVVPDPNLRPEVEFQFDDDTGCTYMQLFHEDLKQLMGVTANTQEWPFEQIMGYGASGLANGTIIVDLNVLLEVNMYDKKAGNPRRQLMMDKWVPIKCTVMQGADQLSLGTTDRLAGSWLRNCLFTATAPENPSQLYISSTKSGLVGKTMLPAVDSSLATRPELLRPNIVAKYTVNAKGVKEPVQGGTLEPGFRGGRILGDDAAIEKA